MPHRRTTSDPGTCYLAPLLDGVLLERVIRDVWRPVLSLRTLRTTHAVATATVTRDLVLVDLIQTAYSVHQLQVHEVTGPPPYTRTQALAEQWAAATTAVIADGIAYGSRFGSGVECLAVWDRARRKLTWHGSQPLGSDRDVAAAACLRLGIGLLP